MMNKISVIIPVYNMERFLSKAIDSVLAQDFDSIEIILVNDGSADGSLGICQSYASRHENIRIVDKSNGGLSDARNAGVDVSTGKYVMFLDADDWLAPNALSQMFKCAEDYNCDIVQGGFYYAYDDYLLFDDRRKISSVPFVLSRQEAMDELINNQYIKNFSWGKLYRREIAKKHPFVTGEYFVDSHPFVKGKHFDDCYWQHLAVNEVYRYGVVKTPLYYYRQRKDSISGEFSERNLDLLHGYEARLEFIGDNYPHLMKPLVNIFWQTLYQCYSLSQKSTNQFVKHLYLSYWNTTNKKYETIFHKYLSGNVEYRLVMRNSKLISLYHLYRRIWSRLFDKRLNRIEPV